MAHTPCLAPKHHLHDDHPRDWVPCQGSRKTASSADLVVPACRGLRLAAAGVWPELRRRANTRCIRAGTSRRGTWRNCWSISCRPIPAYIWWWTSGPTRCCCAVRRKSRRLPRRCCSRWIVRRPCRPTAQSSIAVVKAYSVPAADLDRTLDVVRAVCGQRTRRACHGVTGHPPDHRAGTAGTAGGHCRAAGARTGGAGVAGGTTCACKFADGRNVGGPARAAIALAGRRRDGTAVDCPVRASPAGRSAGRRRTCMSCRWPNSACWSFR